MDPSSNPARAAASPVSALDYEIAQEQASALGRLGRALEVALTALAAFESAQPPSSVPPQAARDGSADACAKAAKRAQLVREASHTLWCFIVQREACGLRDARPVLRDYRVPAEVHARMGVLDRP
jgi:hypothetical protein